MLQAPRLNAAQTAITAAAIAVTCIGLSPALAQDTPTQDTPPPLTPAQEDAVEEIVRAYIRENPEIIQEAIVELGRKREAAQAAAASQQITDQWEELAFNDQDFSIGPEDAPVTIIEFFDYNCGFCKTSADYIQNVIDTHGDDVRVVFKETPIFAGRYEGSTAAASAALAAMSQDKYLDMHFALMAHRGVLTPETVNDIAKDQGMRMRWLTNAMDAPEIADHLTANLAIASEVGLTGTPHFIVRGHTTEAQTVEGANFTRLDQLIAQALEGDDT